MCNKATTERPKSNKRRPTFDENKLLTNCRTVAFDEIFRWRKFLAIQYLERKKQGSAASKVQLEAQHVQAQGHVNTADSNIVRFCSQNYLSLPW